MVIYDLICSNGHEFEGWFRGIEDYDCQHKNGLISCSVCGTNFVSKVLSGAHSIKRECAKTEQKKVKLQDNTFVDPVTLLKNLHHYMKKYGHDVGDKFADEAIKIHIGEKEPRSIYGTATNDDRSELDECGVNYQLLPKLPDECDN